jgi:DNA-binding XRE family transcriptional regulator
MKFIEQIKKLRQEQCLTQEELAAKIHVTRQAVSNLENDKNLPDFETLIVISQTFLLSLD